MLNVFLRLSVSLAFAGLILWGLWLVGWVIMALFPYTAVITLGIFAVMAFTAWRRSRGY